MDIKYIPNGEEGKTCADCKHFERDINMQGVGKCFGKDVIAGGNCNFFEPKEQLSVKHDDISYYWANKLQKRMS